MHLLARLCEADARVPSDEKDDDPRVLVHIRVGKGGDSPHLQSGVGGRDGEERAAEEAESDRLPGRDGGGEGCVEAVEEGVDNLWVGHVCGLVKEQGNKKKLHSRRMTDYDSRLHIDKVLYSTKNAPPPPSLPHQDRREREELRAPRGGEEDASPTTGEDLPPPDPTPPRRGGGGVLSDLERVAPLLTASERERVCSLCSCSSSFLGMPVPAPFLLGVGGLVGLLAGTLCGGGGMSRERGEGE